MYFANMYCYGFHNDFVGITPIVGCMGVVFTVDRTLYAVHIPDGVGTENADAATVFSNWVLSSEQVNKKAGKLFLFFNGTNRPSAEKEGENLRTLLKKPKTTLYRIMKNLGPQSGTSSALSVTIIVRHHHDGLEMKYKQVDYPAKWQDGGKNESGQYKNRPNYCGGKVPKAAEMLGGWYDLDKTTCTIKKIG
jgi:hypothetical protein